jgi:hypothetical protein
MQQVADVKPSRGRAIGEQTFADLLQPLIEPGFRLALAMLHDPQAAEDAVQEASESSRGCRTRESFAPGFLAWWPISAVMPVARSGSPESVSDCLTSYQSFRLKTRRCAAPTCAVLCRGLATVIGLWSSFISISTCPSKMWRRLWAAP